MLIAPFIATMLIGQTSPPATPAAAPAAASKLYRTFKLGETRTYKVSTMVTSERRSTGLNTFIPHDEGFEYIFTTKVTKLLAGGSASIRYNRPKTIYIFGEYGERPETRTAQKGGDLNVDIEVSPTNDLLEFKEVPKPKAKPGKGKAAPKLLNIRNMSASARQDYTNAIGGQFLGTLYQIALGTGDLSFYDISPILPFMPVKVGDTWQKTVGYSPKSLYGSKKLAVQRLDMTYTYLGVITEDKKVYKRVKATTSMDADLGDYLNQSFGATSAQTGIKSMKTTFQTEYIYDLDPNSLAMIRVNSKSSGSTSLLASGPKEPIEETNFTGEGSLVLISAK